MVKTNVLCFWHNKFSKKTEMHENETQLIQLFLNYTERM